MKLPTLDDRRKMYNNKKKKAFSFNCYDLGWNDCLKLVKALNSELTDEQINDAFKKAYPEPNGNASVWMNACRWYRGETRTTEQDL